MTMIDITQLTAMLLISARPKLATRHLAIEQREDEREQAAEAGGFGRRDDAEIHAGDDRARSAASSA